VASTADGFPLAPPACQSVGSTADGFAGSRLEGEADQVDRKAATAPAQMVQPEDGDGKCTPAEPKRVVLRDSTRAARKRREEKANARENAGPHEPDVDPPPD
jgi:hypothetical protein